MTELFLRESPHSPGASPESDRINLQKKYDPNLVYISAYKPPGKAPNGYEWKPAGHHPQKNYVTKWKLFSTTPEVPTMNELPPIDSHGDEVKTYQPQLFENRIIYISPF